MNANTKYSKVIRLHIMQHRVMPFKSLVPSIMLSFKVTDVTKPLLLGD